MRPSSLLFQKSLLRATVSRGNKRIHWEAFSVLATRNANSLAAAAAQPRNPICQSSTTISTIKRQASTTTSTIHDESASSKPSPSASKEQHSEYEHWVRRLYMTNMFNPVKLGLENMQRIHNYLGNPMDDTNRVSVIHIAGTNGKGSVALKIAKTLELMGLRVGLFCSPHVSSFRERMQLNGELISEEEVVQLLPQIYGICETHDIPATFFEITTALAFLFFHTQHADVVVLETGLGGRLDSTNVVAQPACAVITSIGLEHTRILGDTIEKIALEKGGIIKPNRPVVCGPNVPHDVLQQCATEKGASGYYTIQDILGDGTNPDNNLQHNEFVDYDVENARIAEATLRLVERQQGLPKLIGNPIPDSIMQQGTSQRPPCRFECIERDDGLTVILDVAHNPPAMEHLVSKLRASFPDRQFRLIVGMSSDKDLNLCGQSILEATQQNAHAIHLVQAAHPRAAKLEDILERDTSGKLQDCHYDLTDRSVTRQIEVGLELAARHQEILVVCGSVFLMAEAREALGFDEPRDSEYIAEVAGAHLKSAQENFSDTSTNDSDSGKQQ